MNEHLANDLLRDIEKPVVRAQFMMLHVTTKFNQDAPYPPRSFWRLPLPLVHEGQNNKDSHEALDNLHGHMSLGFSARERKCSQEQ
jgi:hypothetical protein